MEKKELRADVKLDTDQAMEQAEKLIQLLRTANSLADELAVVLNNLELNIKV